MSTESTLWDWLQKYLPEGHYSRIESETSPGFPDVHWTIQGISGTWELKYQPKLRKQPFNRKGLRDTQIKWISKQHDHCGRVWIVAGVVDRVFFIPGQYASIFNLMTIPELERASNLTLKRGFQTKRISDRILDLILRD